MHKYPIDKQTFNQLNNKLRKALSQHSTSTLAILATNENPIIASNMIQRHINIIHLWTKRWKIKINETKSSFITFTLNKKTCPQISMNNIPIPICTQVKFLGLTLDSKLTWNPHIIDKRKALNSRLHLLRPLLRSKMNIDTKLLIYKSLLRPLWTYTASNYGEPQNPPTPDQYKPSSPTVSV